MQKSFLLIFIFLFSHFRSFSQNTQQDKVQTVDGIALEGMVKALGSSAPIPDALVIDLGNKENNTQTNKKGYFSFKVTKSSKGILIRADNYQDLNINIENGKLTLSSPFSMEPSADYNTYGIIRAKQKDEISQNSFQQEELSHLPGTGGDAVKALQTLPSVLPANVGSADVVVRGGLPGDNSYFYDDLLLPIIFHFGGAETIIPPRMIESMDFYPGAFSARYSDTIGGVIQLRSPGNIPSRFSGEFELGLVQSGVYLEGNAFSSHENNAKLTDASTSTEVNTTHNNNVTNTTHNTVANEKENDGIGYRVGFRRTYLELYKPLIQKLSNNTSVFTVPQATDYQIILNGNHSNGTWQAYLLGAVDSASLSAPIGNSTTSSGQNSFSFYNAMELTGLRYSLNLSNGYGLRFVVEQRYFIWQQNILGDVVDAKSQLYGIGVILDKKVNEDLSFSVGVRPKYAYDQVGFNVVQYPSGDPTVYFDPELAPRTNDTIKASKYYADSFIDISYSPIKSIKINPGINVLKGPTSTQQALDPRIGVRFDFMKGQTLKFAWGYYSQQPAVQFTIPVYGNPNLELERSQQYVLGHESKFLENYSTDTQLWYKTSQNLTGPAVSNANNKYENSIQSRARGVEVFIKKKASDFWFGWVSYGYSIAEQRDPGSGIWRYSAYDRRHSLNIVYGQKITGRWNVGTRIQYISGSPYSSVPGGTYNQNTGAYEPTADGNTYLINKNDARNPYYMEVDFRTEYDFYFSDWKLTTYLDILNLFNRSNVAYTTYNRDYSNTVQVYGLPLIPSLGVIAKF
ncbi:TonB-dependent receptor plug domain-containing protein [Silvanigrella aquatica]|uniref:Uncharacterized protein n=1 Tax=Silvanigrella aquatica TaxID=1915309 RepID=A0A1L4D0U5_9BACT|nr:TonB-dependent receptor plug domain-containing protein [Silvanigrella aquatica]APJ03825.1 hypothetical protein AXG55_07865 [Silvanigrella aquatica]